MFQGLSSFSLGEALAVRTSRTKLHLEYSWIVLVTQMNPDLFLLPDLFHKIDEDSFNKGGRCCTVEPQI